MERKKHNSGIALVMVLGILSVMVIMAVAFAISMRTERVAAGNYADSVRARHLVHVGIARALDDLARQLGTNGLGSAVGGTNYPPWNATNSYTTNYVNSSTNNLCLLIGKATNFVPRTLWAATVNADNLNANNHWLPVDSIISNGVVAESNRMGRVKYLILNCSGLLDANWVGGAPRGEGTNPAEIAINSMPEFALPLLPSAAPPFGQGAEQFKAKRNNYTFYETFEEFQFLNKNTIWVEFNEYPSNFMVYSSCPAGYWATNPLPGNVCTQVNLAGSVTNFTDPDRKNAIITAFVNSGFLLTDAGVLFSNLLDYVDNDFVPTNFECCVEPVPMINEIVFQSQDDTNGILNSLRVELWYPFVSTPGTFRLSGGFTINDGVGFQNISSNVSINAGGMAVLPFERYASITNPAYNFTLTNIVVETTSGQVVDTITYGMPFTRSVNRNSQVSKQVRDPRFNNNISDTNNWDQTTGGNLGANNTWTANYLPTNYNGDTDTRMYVANGPLRSVAELGYLVYSTNAPWHTVKLYNPGLNPVLGKFGFQSDAFNVTFPGGVFHVPDRSHYRTGDPVTLETTGTLPSPLSIGTTYYVIYESENSFRLASTYANAILGLSISLSDGGNSSTIIPRCVNATACGLVNPNSRQMDALAAVFIAMPVDEYLGGPSNCLSLAAAQTLADHLVNGGFYTNLADIGRGLTIFSGLTDMSGASLAITSELQRESFFRNTCGLLNVRQNLFTIIIEAHVASCGNIPRNPVRQRAVVIVWRDPYTGEMVIPKITWLED